MKKIIFSFFGVYIQVLSKGTWSACFEKVADCYCNGTAADKIRDCYTRCE